jgi:hypothetical protein
MARNLHGPKAAEVQQTGTYTLVDRPFVSLGNIVPATDPGTTIPDYGNGQPFVGFGTVTSANADAWINLPSAAVGTEIYLTNGATGYELRSAAPATDFINAASAGAGAESAIAASLTLHCRRISTTYWLVNNYAVAGTEAAEEAAA